MSSRLFASAKNFYLYIRTFFAMNNEKVECWLNFFFELFNGLIHFFFCISVEKIGFVGRDSNLSCRIFMLKNNNSLL
jgi:hypothetical protein